jgi:hypothetical protein
VRTEDVQVGQTYTAQIPATLPRRYKYQLGGGVAELRRSFALEALRGCRFPVTVAAVTSGPADEPAVLGWRVRTVTATAEVDLTGDQAAALGLPDTGTPYRIRGALLDAEGRPVALPDLAEVRLPARWLHPLDSLHGPGTAPDDAR